MTDERIAWLTARLDEVELVARAVPDGPWEFEHAEGGGLLIVRPVSVGPDEHIVYDHHDYYPETVAAFCHIALHDPRTVLARIEADRRILTQHSPSAMSGHTRCETCVDEPTLSELSEFAEWPCRTFRAVLSAYRYAPGFREEWLSV